jgi:hypothetical protein
MPRDGRAPAALRFALLLSAALLLAPAGARALDEASAAEIRSTIQNQLEAFRRDDAQAAYGFAAPGIQRMFPTSEIFLDMVRRGYAPVYRPRSFAFERMRDTDGRIVQEVGIVDADGVRWLAVYSMEKQDDGTWRISGCSLVKAPDQSV